MKTTTETTMVPFETQTYACEVGGCDFTSECEEEARHHHGLKHAVKEVTAAAEHYLYRFESEEDLEAYHAARRGRPYDGGEASWEGPGWYVERPEERPCKRSCCNRLYLDVVPASHVLRDLREQKAELEQHVSELEQLLEGGS